MSFLSFLGSGDNGAGLMRKTQLGQQGDINKATGKINSIFAAFGPEFYNKAIKAYEQQAMPGVQQEAQTAEQGLGYSLARKGLTESSSATKLGQGLANSVNQQKQGVVNSAQDFGRGLQQQQGQQQAGLTAEASAANQPASNALGAIGTAGSFQAPGWFQGIGETIGNWANTYLNEQNKSAYGGSFMPPQTVYGPYSNATNWSTPGVPAVQTVNSN